MCQDTTKQQLKDAGLTPEIIRQIGIAVEAGQDEDTQREWHGDATVDWVKKAHEHLVFEKNHKNPRWR